MNQIANDVKYAVDHVWAKRDTDDQVRVGISDFAQRQLGDIVYVELPAVGRQVKAGEACAVIESVKAASDIHSPVSGTVVAVNDELRDAPEKINHAPYASWLFALAPQNPQELDTLLDADGYRAATATD